MRQNLNRVLAFAAALAVPATVLAAGATEVISTCCNCCSGCC